MAVPEPLPTPGPQNCASSSSYPTTMLPNLDMERLIEAVKSQSVYFVPAFLAYLAASSSSLRVWIAAKHTPTFVKKDEEKFKMTRVQKIALALTLAVYIPFFILPVLSIVGVFIPKAVYDIVFALSAGPFFFCLLIGTFVELLPKAYSIHRNVAGSKLEFPSRTIPSQLLIISACLPR
ncbi:hypothetical protein SISSUDRAFT_665715 [Sistotremastrum suecicum HHB10207 ss-3]|uniref:Uncharacterized protein n=1 Tax=Sistotremastrum suecicum HHB10207 ss-3 TaxID=1314776 RepID=A0A166E3A6_9AGAM|nr:hypothetical protein SISSUDRAFT_665715 [Sistotremastrum suecicum HHB10207 ss-3]